jgi:hypothetical protein
MITFDEIEALQSNPKLELNTPLAPDVVCIKCGERVHIAPPAPNAFLPVNYYDCWHCGPTGVVPMAEPAKLQQLHRLLDKEHIA